MQFDSIFNENKLLDLDFKFIILWSSFSICNVLNSSSIWQNINSIFRKRFFFSVCLFVVSATLGPSEIMWYFKWHRFVKLSICDNVVKTNKSIVKSILHCCVEWMREFLILFLLTAHFTLRFRGFWRKYAFFIIVGE